MSLGVFIVRRLLFSLLVLLIVSIVVFIVVQVLPGDVASMILGTDATPEDVATMRETLGLNRPAYIRYLDWVCGAVRGDWGTSLRLNQPDDANQHDRGEGAQLHPHRAAEGHGRVQGDLPPRAAERAAADDHDRRDEHRLADG